MEQDYVTPKEATINELAVFYLGMHLKVMDWYRRISQQLPHFGSFCFSLDDFLSGETELRKGSSFSKSKWTFQIFIWEAFKSK